MCEKEEMRECLNGLKNNGQKPQGGRNALLGGPMM
jgi:hypothetical protein